MASHNENADRWRRTTVVLCRVTQSPFQVFGFAYGSSVAASLLCLPLEAAAHAYSQNPILVATNIIERPFTGLWDALKYLCLKAGGLGKVIQTARMLRFATTSLSLTQPIVFTMKEVIHRATSQPRANPFYVATSSNEECLHWMGAQFLSGGLAGFAFSGMVQLGASIRKAPSSLFGQKLPAVAQSTSTPTTPPSAILPRNFFVLALPFTLHRAIYHGLFDTFAPPNPLGAVCVGVASAWLASAVADTTHSITRLISGHELLVRQGFAATAKGRLVRSMPGALALALFDQSRQIYCTVKSKPPG